MRRYVCFHKHCLTPNRDFADRDDWMMHVLQVHWKAWYCPAGSCASPNSDAAFFKSAAECRIHVDTCHPGAFPASIINSAVHLSERPMDLRNGVQCPMCGKLVRSVEEYKKHVGDELDELSLYALAKLEGLEGSGHGGNEETLTEPKKIVADEESHDPSDPAHLSDSGGADCTGSGNDTEDSPGKAKAMDHLGNYTIFL